MPFVADLHVHSYLSRATSRECCLEGLQRWAQLKGVGVVGTGDFTHPTWYAELRDKLVPAGPGLYRLRPDLARTIGAEVHATCRADVQFMVSGEISSIYKRDGQVRKVHSLLLLPDLDAAGRVNARLGALGNIKSDGRPILGLDPRHLLTILLECCPDAYLIPAHIWTPWFSMLGSKSGFDSLEQCFGDLSEHVFAAETGLSSDPPMNWRVSGLDRVALVSNSDLHSPANMARNANLFLGEPDFHRMRDGLRRRDPAVCGGTIDMFPEEGKYHLDGHRKCGVVLEPEQSLAQSNLCPTCGKELVLGVLHRVAELADRPWGVKPPTALPCQYIIPLPELLGELYDCGVGSKKVDAAYHKLLSEFGPELRILREVDPEAVERRGPALLAEAIRRVRASRVIRKGGYDGEYGQIRVFEEGEMDKLRRQAVLLTAPARAPRLGRGAAAPVGGTPAATAVPAVRDASPEYRLTDLAAPPCPAAPVAQPHREPEPEPAAADAALPAGLAAAGADPLAALEPEQRAAAADLSGPVLIVAGPGTGKTRTLTHRIAHLVTACGVAPGAVLAVTFTNRAAREMRERLQRLVPPAVAGRLTVTTFHAFALDLLRRHPAAAGLPADFAVVDQDEAAARLQARTGCGVREAARLVEALGLARRSGTAPEAQPDLAAVAALLRDEHLVDLDSLVPLAGRLLSEHDDIRAALGLRHLCVDEYQDINRPQYELIRCLAPGGAGLCAIGDPDQAIYGFRGADVRHFLEFQQDFPGTRLYHLTRNHRSDSFIVRAADRVIGPGRSALSAVAASVLAGGLRVRVHRAPSAAAEAEFIAHEVEKWLGGVAHFSLDSERVERDGGGAGVGFGDVAVLVRLRAQLGPLAEALQRLGLPVQAVDDQALAEHPEVREVVAAARQLAAAEQARPAGDALGHLLGSANTARERLTPGSVLQRCLDLAVAFPGSLREFLDQVALRQPADEYDAQAERVTLLTLHAAKGLEFPVVFLAGCEDGLLPWIPDGRPADLDEERRLLYVGMTRAERVLYLTHAGQRSLFGKTARREPSRFLGEIEEALRETLVTVARPPKPEDRQLTFDFGA